MSDHLHILLVGTSDGAAFLPFMTVLRQRSAIAFRRQFKERVWQEGYFDRLLRPQEITSAVVEYIVRNPVRAGLAPRPEDYPFSSAFAFPQEPSPRSAGL
jgi:REP element-mobilizing transposase RayT